VDPKAALNVSVKKQMEIFGSESQSASATCHSPIIRGSSADLSPQADESSFRTPPRCNKHSVLAHSGAELSRGIAPRTITRHRND